MRDNAFLARLLRELRRMLGMPDYGAHVAHLRAHHPEAPIPSEGEFFAAFVSRRYDDGPTRCC